MTELLSLLRKTEYKFEIEKMQEQFTQVKENSPNILLRHTPYVAVLKAWPILICHSLQGFENFLLLMRISA